MLQLHIANKNYSSWSLRPWILMRVLDIPFEEKLHFFESAGPSPSFLAFSPTGRVPCLHDGDTIIWESLAIVEYLAESHPQIWPENKNARAFARSASAEMHSGFAALREICGMNCGIRVMLDEFSPRLTRDLTRLQALWNEGLTRFGGPFLAGKTFSAVDAFFAPVAFRVQTYGLMLDAPCDAYVKRLLALPAMQEWYEAALSETEREPGHEADAAAVGEWLHDYRAKA
jgi:glutathione S-transferase